MSFAQILTGNRSLLFSFEEKKKEKEKVFQTVVLSADNFGGECTKNSILYFLMVWSLAIMALVKNLSRAIGRKIFINKTKPLTKTLWEMGRDVNHFSIKAIERFSPFIHKVKTKAAGWEALDVCYNYSEKIVPLLGDNLEGQITRYFLGKLHNRQAITNRKKIVSTLLVDAFNKFSSEDEIRMVSVASGSAQVVIRAVSESNHPNIRVVLIDFDKNALKESMRLAEAAGLGDRFKTVHGTPKSLKKVCREFVPHIIEMVGFLDYQNKQQAIKLINEIRNYLLTGGIFITCNIRRNPEKILLDWYYLWPMIYRNERQLFEVMLKGGFSQEKIKVFYEPHKIHGIGVCTK